MCDVDAGGQKSTKTVPIPAGVTLAGDPDLGGGIGEVLKVGQKSTLHFFEPLTMFIQKLQTEVVRSEQRQVGGKSVRAFLVKTTNSVTGPSETWVDAKGQLLEESGTLGLRIVREDVPLTGPTVAYEPPQDFAVATSIKTAVRLPAARKTQTLRLKISGIPDRDLILTDVRQQVADRQTTGDKTTATYIVQARELPAAALPVVAPGNPALGTGDAAYLGVKDPTIVQEAKSLPAARPTARSSPAGCAPG